MLVVSTKNGACLVVRESEIGTVALADAETRLGWCFAATELVAESAKPIRVADLERIPCAVLDLIGPQRGEALGYLAYQVVDELSASARGRARDCVATFYHQISDTLRRILLLYEVLTTGSRRILVVEDEIADLIVHGVGSYKWLRVTVIGESRLPLTFRGALRRARRVGRAFLRSPLGVSADLVRKGARVILALLVAIDNRSASFDSPTVVPGVTLPARAGQDERPEIVVLTVDDEGKRSNFGPAQEILHQLRSRGIEAVVLTESPFVANELRKEGLTPTLLASDHNWPGAVPAEPLALPRSLPAGINVDARNLLDEILRRRQKYFSHRMLLLKGLMAGVERLRTIRAVLSVNETLAPAVVAGQWAKKSGRAWIGHFPILVGRRPDGYYFPADFHLAYGEQLRDHMVEARVRPETIEVVGSYTYDKHRGRDRGRDRGAVERAFPKLGERKLVTALTEVLPAPETELVPILTALTSLPDVHVVLKVHPDDPLEQFEALARKLGIRYQIDIVKSCDLSQLLGASDLLICAMSNVAIEAAVTGTPTLMCDFSGRTTVINLVQEGLCVGCTEPAKLAETVQTLLTDPVTRKQALDLMTAGIRRFNGPNDGRSAERIVDFVIAHAQWASATEPSKAPLRRAPVEMARRLA
jgi:glycosyltransferase involved in cell wall biosynthesis